MDVQFKLDHAYIGRNWLTKNILW